MKRLTVFFMASLLAYSALAGAATPSGEPRGGVPYTLPQWFKQSFLDFRHDLEEARQRKRHVMVFLHLDGCPYCAKMLAESFAGGDNAAFIQRHFDVVAVNVRGSLDVVWIDGAQLTERTLSQRLRVVATPTLVFLAPDAGQVLQLTGYRDPPALRRALEFVQGRHYRSRSFRDDAEPRAAGPGGIMRYARIGVSQPSAGSSAQRRDGCFGIIGPAQAAEPGYRSGTARLCQIGNSPLVLRAAQEGNRRFELFAGIGFTQAEYAMPVIIDALFLTQ